MTKVFVSKLTGLNPVAAKRIEKETLAKAAAKKARKGKRNVRYSDKQKLLALQTYQQTGSLKDSALTAGIGYDYLRQITLSDWWKKSVKEFQETNDAQLDAEMTDILQNSVRAIGDRVQTGDYMWDSATQMFKRKPLSAKDLTKVAEVLFKQRQQVRDKPVLEAAQATLQDHLAKIAQALSTNSRQQNTDILDVDFIIKEPNDLSMPEGETTSPSKTNALNYTQNIEPDDDDDTET